MEKYVARLVSSWKCKYVEGRYFLIYLVISGTFYNASIYEVIFEWECIL